MLDPLTEGELHDLKHLWCFEWLMREQQFIRWKYVNAPLLAAMREDPDPPAPQGEGWERCRFANTLCDAAIAGIGLAVIYSIYRWLTP